MRELVPAASLAALLSIVLAAAPATAETPEKQTLTLTNAATRIVECAVVVDGKTRTMLRIRPGKRWADAYDPRRTVQLVCERTKEGVYAVKAGATYRFSDGARRVDLAEATAE